MSCDEMQCGTIVVPVVAEISVDLSDDGLSVAASDGHVSRVKHIILSYFGNFPTT